MMSEPFLAEIRMIGFTFAPRGWALCDGQILPINQNQSLYSLLGTTYGGDGRTSFALPDLRGRAPLHADAGYPLGDKGGAENVALDASEMPEHTHAYHATCNDVATDDPNDAKFAPTAWRSYRASGERTAMSPDAVAETGGDAAHNNMQPYLALNFAIALTGLFPSRP